MTEDCYKRDCKMSLASCGLRAEVVRKQPANLGRDRCLCQCLQSSVSSASLKNATSKARTPPCKGGRVLQDPPRLPPISLVRHALLTRDHSRNTSQNSTRRP